MSEVRQTNPNWVRDTMKLTKKNVSSGIKQATILGASIAKIEAPVDTGELKSSIAPSVIDDNNGVFGTGVDYAPYVEYGAPRRNIKPQPFMRNSFERLKTFVPKIFKGFAGG